MLPLFFTRQYLFERRSARRVHPTKSMIYSAENNLYAVNRVDSALLPNHRSTMIFDCDLHQGMRRQKVFVGLMETDSLAIASRSPGIGISMDLQTGLVTDVVNGQGILGYLEDAPVEFEGPLHLRVEVDIIGRVLLPRILVGDDVILHPALYLDVLEGLSALVGTSLHPPCDARFENATLRTRAPDGGAVLSVVE
jgi:hypothetical protein